MPEAPTPKKRPGSRPWLLTVVACGLLLVVAIITGLWSALSKLGRTMEIMDQPGASSEDLAQMAEDSANLTRYSLYIGAPIALLYLIALGMYRRSKQP
ncbi:MAG: hypothetical protein O3A87_07260 [Verrucomicrobia bacterium]|nr:hypothetical protein [Verrucomicrobiota bacterium]MDA1006265.1 hypothetical protein [Verrucomicrobiota bacterium]